MAFSRTLLPRGIPTACCLTSAMAAIGMEFAASPDPTANIEDTLFFASSEAMDREDFRVLSVLVGWFEIHHPWVNADRLVKVVEAIGSDRVRAFWAALAAWQGEDRRFARLVAAYQGPRIDPIGFATDFQIERHGEDSRFRSSPLRIPANFIRGRPSDILGPSELARRHLAYRWRIIIGPTYRADVWAELSRRPELPPAELARRAYASFATAWGAKRDFQIVMASSSAEGHSASA